MEHDFWHQRWRNNEIGFHEIEGSYLLKSYFESLELSSAPRIFVPLCGKTRDIAWLLDRGVEVVANELNENAVIALFSELDVEPIVKPHGVFTQYSAPKLCVFVGDFFALNSVDIGALDGVYDRAAIVALPQSLRDKYTAHLLHITNYAQQLLVTFDYDQSLLAGPPFSVTADEVQRHYSAYYTVKQLYRDRIDGGFKGQKKVFDAVYLLQK
ncbi:thiopurine S-methyltransferase [Paraglaciecola aquimarina]|uniref:Thiopurine S-methyltransferase n=1 Tax=Paraglaciecola aquimarina TaxID=1235557 RepID=A0ABU3SUQ0_9ALTE|nr:thiopurine S-methyltransferase [Paraglaciecola aquimarina]MDU0353682.1 thiopurine S-methyltransferase [Paraglaciecola aquimarina]